MDSSSRLKNGGVQNDNDDALFVQNEVTQSF